MKYDVIVMKGNWTDRVDAILEHEGIDKNLITAMQITWDIEKKETKLVFTAGVKVPCCIIAVMQAARPELQKVTTPYNAE